MGCEEDVFKIVKKIDNLVANKSTNADSSLDVLKALNDLPITLEVLQKTRIGMTVNSLRKNSSDDAVISLSKSLIKSWKKLLGGGSSEKKDKPGQSKQSCEEGRSSNNSDSKPGSPNDDQSKQTAFPKKGSDTSDAIRLKCREMLTNALKFEDMPDDALDPDDVAAQLEDEIFAQFKDVNMKYKNRIRSRVSNLKDPKNPHLRLNVITGVITPGKVANMTAEELASDEMKELRQKFTKDGINDHQLSVTSGTTTSLLKCGKCKKRNCTYNQVQTRSADEPMTTFVFCNECGNRWKVNQPIEGHQDRVECQDEFEPLLQAGTGENHAAESSSLDDGRGDSDEEMRDERVGNVEWYVFCF
ncbi:Transcription elongation factor A protein 1 [Nymphon striatum]|nr:Transcription elongation factor A protein 1 [Nymphon striatum]